MGNKNSTRNVFVWQMGSGEKRDMVQVQVYIASQCTA